MLGESERWLTSAWRCLLSVTASPSPAWQSPAPFLVREWMERKRLPSPLLSRLVGKTRSWPGSNHLESWIVEATCRLERFRHKQPKRSSVVGFSSRRDTLICGNTVLSPLETMRGKSDVRQGQRRAVHKHAPGGWTRKPAVSFPELKSWNASQFHLLSDGHNLLECYNWKYLQDHKSSHSHFEDKKTEAKKGNGTHLSSRRVSQGWPGTRTAART